MHAVDPETGHKLRDPVMLLHQTALGLFHDPEGRSCLQGLGGVRLVGVGCGWADGGMAIYVECADGDGIDDRWQMTHHDVSQLPPVAIATSRHCHHV